MFNKHEEKHTSSQKTLKKEVNIGGLNHPLERTMHPISPQPTQNLGSPAWACHFGA